MFGSMKLGRPFGIDLYVHGTFWLLPLFAFFNGALSGDYSAAAFEVAVLLALFGCVVLHEVGHALAARYYGIGTRDITLYPIGGVASLERMPEKPWREIAIALAGPAVNVAIAAGLLAGLILGSYALPDGWASFATGDAAAFLDRLLVANLFLALFNLLPAFPMDGGRVLRAALSLGMPRVEATRAAVAVGTVVAAGFLMIGLFGFPPLLAAGNWSLILVAVFVYLLGHAELNAERERAARRMQTGGFTGWRWDPLRKVWSEWRDGALVREVDAM